MRTLSLFLPIFLLCAGAGACSHSKGNGDSKEFRLPEVPATLKSPEERADFLSLHYWDHFDFADTSLLSRPEIAEQAFVNFISILPYSRKAQAAVDTLFSRAAGEEKALRHFMSLAGKYLYEPNSPMRDDELHILVLRSLTASPRIAEAYKARPRHQLAMALKNRRGSVAADFTITLGSGDSLRLSQIKAEFLLLYFNDPGCDDCARVKGFLAQSATLSRLVESGRVRPVAVCVEGRTPEWEHTSFPDGWTNGYDDGRRLTDNAVYDLKAMPTLYLLDSARRVVLKDAQAERVEAWLEKHTNTENTHDRRR